MLCEICDGLSLSANDFIVGNLDRDHFYDDYHNLGTVGSVRHRASSCSLCRIVLETVNLAEPTGQNIIENSACQLYWQGDGFQVGDQDPKTRFLRVTVDSPPQSKNEYHRICLLGSDVPWGAPKLFLGRKVPEKIDIGLVKIWIRICQHWHGDSCTALISRPECSMPPGFRVLDTWDTCIVSEPQCECMYIALSYVWGGASSALKLTVANFEEMRQPGSLKRKWHQIPRTIQDAIDLTSSLGQRFLWVDSLCIIQDDHEDKGGLVPFMDLIYDRAFLTIIAATGHDSQAGLPGFRKCTRHERQKIEELKPGLRVTSPKHLSDALEESIYETRGWTYQEKVLSRRSLFFINGQIVFKCRSAVYREDIALENRQIMSCQDLVGYQFRRGLVADDEPHNVYVGTLWEYSNRKLSYDVDVINAFTGVLGVVHRRMVGDANLATPSSGSICGLPMAVFDWVLLWESVKPLKRKMDTLWPSWSWCGWNGRASLLLTGMTGAELQDWLCHRTWIKWVVGEHRAATEAPILSSISCAQWQNPLFPSDVYPAVTQSSYTKNLDQPVPHKVRIRRDYPYYFLYFATLSISLNLQPTYKFRGSWHGYTITEMGGSPCGKIELDPEWEHIHGQKYEFLALSEAKSREIVGVQLPARGAERDTSEWDAYHVLMISYPDADAPAERIGLGIIYKKSMREESGAIWKEVWMQ